MWLMLKTGVVQKVMTSAACNMLTADESKPAAMMMMSRPVQRKKGASATLRVERSSPTPAPQRPAARQRPHQPLVQIHPPPGVDQG